MNNRVPIHGLALQHGSLCRGSSPATARVLASSLFKHIHKCGVFGVLHNFFNFQTFSPVPNGVIAEERIESLTSYRNYRSEIWHD